MHRSRIGVVLIDHPAASYSAAAHFWQAARGGGREVSGAPADDDPYESLEPIGGGIMLELQRLGDGTPRVHLDVETDDIAAETARLLAAGATVVDQRDDYAVLADPGGVLVCVVPVQTGDAFEEHAVSWP